MKIDCGPTWAKTKARKEKWHSWFAWFPVRVGPHDCRWLEWIERKGKHHYSYSTQSGWWTWNYRKLIGADND